MPKSDFEWAQECQYISRVAEQRGSVSEMNHSLDTFMAYCLMQRDSATRGGFHDAAQYIQHCIDDLEIKP